MEKRETLEEAANIDEAAEQARTQSSAGAEDGLEAQATPQDAQATQTHLVEVHDLKTYFHTASGVARAVDGVSFTLDRGKTLAIVGESGSGKSVTANSLMRLLPKSGKIEGGSINVNGTDIVHASDTVLRELRGKDISMIFQDPMTALDPVFKVGSQMIENIRIHDGLSRAEARERAIEMLKLVSIPNPEKRLDSYPYELSGGMSQRVMIAMAVSCHPKFIIADEPTTALDVTVQAQVLALLKSLQETLNTGILLITHNLGIVWQMAHDVMVMYAGRTCEYAPMTELYEHPLHPYTWGLLDSMPKLSDSAKTDLKTIPGVPPDLRLTGTCCNFYNRCPYACEKCRAEVPPLVEVSPGHFVACHRQNGEQTLAREEQDCAQGEVL